MSALPFTPLTITPRPTESRRLISPSQREGAGGWVQSVPNNAASPNRPHAIPPSQREGAGGRADSDSPAPHFSPDQTTAAAIIDDFAAQDETLRGIADKYDTTIESLTLWLARPDIKERLFALESACAARARLVVANNLAAIANKLLHLLDEAKLDHESIHRVPAATPHAFAARMQSRESARKTANLLLRIARYVPSANPAPFAPPPKTNPTRKRGATPAPIAQQTPEGQQPSIAPPLPAPRGEDRLATGQAGEGTAAHLNADALQYTAAAPTINPTRQRQVTAPSLPAAPSEFPALTSPERERAGHPRAESWTVTRELAATPAARSAVRPATQPLVHQLSQHTREPAEAASRAPPSTPN